MVDAVIIPARFRGPPDSGNGGYVCGVVASLLHGPAEVTLRSPPALDHPFEVERIGDALRVTAGELLVAEAKPTSLALDVPRAPTFEEATAASARFPWHDNHPYPTCFVCGPKRRPGDGLCVYPGSVADRDIAAAPFVVDASVVDEDGRVKPAIAWALLDCPSWFGFQCFNDFDAKMLLGRLAARIDALPRIGDRCIAVGWTLGREGRKISCGSALYSEAGALLALGQATWIVRA